MKGKIRRKSRALRRWYLRKGLTPQKALVAMNRRFNSRFYGKDSEELSWKYWYFPFINTTDGLSKVDHFMQDTQRFIFTGKHSKANYNKCSYETLKESGYLPLVHEYHKFRQMREQDTVRMTITKAMK